MEAIKEGDHEQIMKPLPAANKILTLSVDREIRIRMDLFGRHMNVGEMPSISR